jgi:hypothetical protein
MAAEIQGQGVDVHPEHPVPPPKKVLPVLVSTLICFAFNELQRCMWLAVSNIEKVHMIFHMHSLYKIPFGKCKYSICKVNCLGSKWLYSFL